MTTFVKLILSMTLLLAVSAAALGENISVVLPNGTSWRGDTAEKVTVQYQDGTMVSGFVTRSTDLYIVFRIGDGPDEQLVIPLSELRSISSGDAAAPAAEESSEDTGGSSVEPAGAATESDDARNDTGGKGPRGVFYLPLKDAPYGGMVGDSIRVKEIEEIIAQADEAGPGQIIVLDIESGGGSVPAAIIICERIQQAKNHHSFVAWCGQSISAAAYAAVSCDRIVFKPTGHLGSITMHSGGKPVSDEMEEKWITMLEHTLIEAGRSPYLARAMVVNLSWLSYTKDPVTGKCTHYNVPQGVPGEIVLSLPNENCVYTADEAKDSCLSIGTASSKEELAKLLDLAEWNELGSGQELYDDWHKTLIKAKREVTLQKVELGLLGEYTRVKQIKDTIAIYKDWQRLWKKAPEFCLYGGGIPSYDQLERMIEELELELRNMARRP